MSKRIFLSVGDLSGDLNCALLVQELLKRQPNLKIEALCGPHTREAGAEQIGDTNNLGVIGFASALATLPRTLLLSRAAKKWVGNNRPDAVILCDWGGFNTRFIPYLQALNIPIFYYFPPRSWQKHGEGGLHIAQVTNSVATPFEWSARRLNEAGGHATWVGHPILENVAALPSREEIRAALKVAPDEKLVVALPGSRSLELKYIAPHVAQACQLLARPDRKIIVAAATGATRKLAAVFGDEVSIVEGQTLELLRAADAAIVKSGTSTLEAAALNCPQVVVYDVPALLKLQGSLTGVQRKFRFAAMPNIICDREIIPELLVENCRGPIIAKAIEKLLTDPVASSQMRTYYNEVRAALGAELPYTATHKTADLVFELLNQ